MANLVTGAMGSLIPKLGELLKEEYNLQTGMKKRIKSLTEELESAQAALRKMEMVPWDQLDEQVKIWARQVREASYDMEDVMDTFIVSVQGPDSTQEKSLLKRLSKKITILFTKIMARRRISVSTKNIMSHLEQVTERCRRYNVDDIAVAMPDTASIIDPRLHAMYNKVEDLVGIDKSSGELISILQSPQLEGPSNLKKKIVVIVGVGGLGKTTLAKVVYDKLKGDFDCTAFVPVGRKPNPHQVIQGILIDLDNTKYMNSNFAAWHHISQLINELRKFLHEKRYFIVIDDLWEKESWEAMKLAFDDNNCDSRIIITTRNREVSQKGNEVYELQTLPDDSSRELFFTRVGGHEETLVDNKPNEVTVKFLKKCGGIPLAIITIASLLAGKPRERWDELYRCIGFGSEDNNQAKNTMRIVSYSYYDLPAHLRTCLLYLSAFPEDSFIHKGRLVSLWVAEGFVKKKQGVRLIETGEGYFHDLINRSMLEAVRSQNDDSIVHGCRVHDMVLDFIRSMSDQENFLSVVLDNDQGPLLESNNVPRRLAHHNRTMGHEHHGHGDDSKMAKVRSMFAIGCGIEVSYPFHGFTLLRVLVIDNCKATKGSSFVFTSEHLRHLSHLRFLSIQGTCIVRILEEIGHLRFLQTLDLKGSSVEEFPLLGGLPEQLLYLRIPIFTWTSMHSNDGICSLTRLTYLEELSISVSRQTISWCLPKQLRVLEIPIMCDSETTERDFWECVGHLNKLEHLKILGGSRLHVTDFILPDGLRHFEVNGIIKFSKLPSCVNASCLPNLSHLELSLKHLDEHDLMMLGRLPELRFIGLDLSLSAPVSSVVIVSEQDASLVYFPKLRCCELREVMVSFHANEEDKSISFHMWNGGRHIEEGSQGTLSPVGIDFFRNLALCEPYVCEDKLQSSIISYSTSGGGGTSAASATGGGAPRGRFMPCLQVIRFTFMSSASWEDRSWDNLGFEYGLPSLREIELSGNEKMVAVLRSAAEAHPNRPAFRVGLWWHS